MKKSISVKTTHFDGTRTLLVIESGVVVRSGTRSETTSFSN